MGNIKNIVITPVRNEAWVLDAFLTCTSSWADHIIIADQHSTDGSREIAMRFPKVILIDNPDTEMHQARVRKMLFEVVDKIEGDKIVWAMDADEFLSVGFEKTNGWKTIMNSEPNSIFCFRWQNLEDDFLHESISSDNYSEWACHLSIDKKLADLYSTKENRAIHEARIPCINDATYTNIEDIKFVHLARLNRCRTKNKYAFYQVSTLDKLNRRISAVSLYRTYHNSPKTTELNEEVKLTSMGSDKPYNHLVKLSDHGFYYIEEILAIFMREGIEKFLKLDIWDNPYLKDAGIIHPKPLRYKILHWYLRKTRNNSDNLLVRYIDRVLKIFV